MTLRLSFRRSYVGCKNYFECAYGQSYSYRIRRLSPLMVLLYATDPAFYLALEAQKTEQLTVHSVMKLAHVQAWTGCRAMSFYLKYLWYVYEV